VPYQLSAVHRASLVLRFLGWNSLDEGVLPFGAWPADYFGAPSEPKAAAKGMEAGDAGKFPRGLIGFFFPVKREP
jgi:hypothetical protein